MTALRSPRPTPRLLAGIRDIIDETDAFFVDVWGVLHDGVQPYAPVIDCLRHIKAAGKPVCLLSNAPRRAHLVADSLSEMGIGRDLYTEIVTSGEVTRTILSANADQGHDAYGRNCLQMGIGRYLTLIDDLDYQVVEKLGDADFILCAGPGSYDASIGDFDAFLAAAAQRDVPMICANPDINVMVGNDIVACGGAIAQMFEQKGGRVMYVGKPHAAVYAAAARALGIGRDARVFGVGDSPRTDVAGARGYGINSLLIAGGLHKDELHGADRMLCGHRIESFLTPETPVPDAIASQLSW